MASQCPFWLQFFTRYHSFHAFAHWLFPGGIQAKFGFSFHTQTNKKWLQHQFNDKKIGSDMFYCKQKNIEPTTKPKQIWSNFSQLSHKKLIFMNSWPVRNGIKNLILSLFCNNFYGILNPPKKFFFRKSFKKVPVWTTFFHDFLKFSQVCGILKHPPLQYVGFWNTPHCTAPIAV